MFADPINVDADSPNPALAWTMIQQDGLGSQRRDSGGLYGMTINHSTSKSGDRHYLKVVKTVNATNPYSGLVSPQSASVSLTIASPSFGFSASDLADLFKALQDTIASDDFAIDRFIAFES